uniref:Branched-chain-amino-acid transaminase n=1 Tax=Aureoumbra lagunensis TaxID=44058 RepID=A0A7S3NIU8_9STRA
MKRWLTIMCSKSSKSYYSCCSIIITAFFFSLSSALNSQFSSFKRINVQKLSISDVGTAPGLDWSNIGFEYRQTRSLVRYKYRDGIWDDGEDIDASEPYIPVHAGATGLHYGQSLFEGLKAQACADGQVRLFRPYDNAKRMRRGAERTLMIAPDEVLFVEACKRAVMNNLDFVPPYGSKGALYIRPLLFGSGPRIGLQPADAYDFLVIVTPVAEYYRSAGLKAVDALVIDDFDRAAPRGVGSVKLAGNYAPDLQPNFKAKEDGFQVGLYLDAVTHTYVEEFSTSNLFGIKGNTYLTPESSAILPSITNDSLMRLAESVLNLKVERRQIPFEELASFSEVAACGTAVVVTPVGTLTRRSTLGSGDSVFSYPKHPISTQLYDIVTQIQCGDRPDEFDWLVDVSS